MLPVGVKLSCLLILRSCGGKRDKLRIFTLFSVLGDSGEVWWSNTWISSIHWVSCPVILRSEEFLTRVTELELCGFRLLIFFQDYSRNFLFLELISLSGGRGYYRYGHVLWLLSLEKKKIYWIFRGLWMCEWLLPQKLSCSRSSHLLCDLNKRL